MNIQISNSTVYINDRNPAEEARDQLLTIMYYARNKETLGGYDAWLELLDFYYCGDFEAMKNYISGLSGMGGATRNKCLRLIDIITKEI
jgi:hypothetical protein